MCATDPLQRTPLSFVHTLWRIMREKGQNQLDASRVSFHPRHSHVSVRSGVNPLIRLSVRDDLEASLRCWPPLKSTINRGDTCALGLDNASSSGTQSMLRAILYPAPISTPLFILLKYAPGGFALYFAVTSCVGLRRIAKLSVFRLNDSSSITEHRQTRYRVSTVKVAGK